MSVSGAPSVVSVSVLDAGNGHSAKFLRKQHAFDFDLVRYPPDIWWPARTR